MLLALASALLLSLAPEQIVKEMTLEEKVGQLFIVPACPERDDHHLQNLIRLLNEFHVGGILLKQGTQQLYQTLLFALKTPLPLLHVGDGEWGVNMRVTDAVRFPRNLTLGAIQDLSLLEAFGREVGWECRQVGIDLNLAPVADVNSNPKNPVIGTRSFGDQPARVAACVSAVIRGMQSQGVLACAKHFPDHGDTTLDSHDALPKTSLRSLESFHAASKAGVAAILTAHLLEESSHQVVTFSPQLVQGLLRDQLSFPGLIITDALNMGAIAKYTPADEAALNALKAGHDLLLYGDHVPEKVDQIVQHDVPSAIRRIIRAIQDKELAESILDSHVIRIIQAKQKLLYRDPISSSSLMTKEALQLKQSLYDHAVTLVSNHHLPLRQETPIEVTFLGGASSVLSSALEPLVQPLLGAVKIVCVMQWNASIQKQVKQLNPDILIVMAAPYGLMNLPTPSTLIIGYESDPMAEESVRKVLFGEMQAQGRLPVKIEMAF